MHTKTFATLFLSALSTLAFAKWPEGAKPLGQASLAPKSGSKVGGTIDFATSPKGLVVRTYVSGLPKGEYGLHIHENGNCDSADASSAGGHFNPMHQHHGSPGAKEKHVGDLGNLVIVDDKGIMTSTIPTPTEAGFPGWDVIIGKSIVIHEKVDDLKTDPSGNSGKRIACGVIRVPDASPQK